MRVFAIALPLVLVVACKAPEAPVPPSATATPDAAPAASMPPAASDAPMQRFRAFGTEPFWNVDVHGNALRYTTPEDQAGQMLSGTRAAFAKGIEISGSHGGKPFVLVVRGGACNDGMSDNSYTMDAVFDVDGQSLKGCAELRE